MLSRASSDLASKSTIHNREKPLPIWYTFLSVINETRGANTEVVEVRHYCGTHEQGVPESANLPENTAQSHTL